MGSCLNNLIRGLSGTTALLAAHMAVALPIELTATQFAAQTVGLATITEGFEGFLLGNQLNPLTIANGTVIFPGVPYVVSGAVFCPNGSGCLIDNSDFTNTRTFSALPAGTTYWSTDIRQVQFGAGDTLRVTVEGGSGTLTVEAIGRDFWGFHDALGISAVSFLNLGSGFGNGGFNTFANYGFDNVTTASIPTPSTLTLLAVGGLWFSRRIRRQLPSPASKTK